LRAVRSLPGTADNPQAAHRRLDSVQDDPDLHLLIVPGAANGNIRQLADACRSCGPSTLKTSLLQAARAMSYQLRLILVL